MTTMPWKARKCTLSLKGNPQGHTQSTKDGVKLFCRWLFCFIIFVFVWSSFGPCSHPQVGPWPSSLSGLPFFSLSRALGLFSHSPALRVLNICEPVLLSFLKALEGLFLGYQSPGVAGNLPKRFFSHWHWPLIWLCVPLCYQVTFTLFYQWQTGVGLEKNRVEKKSHPATHAWEGTAMVTFFLGHS